MNSEKKDGFLNQFKWHLVVICMALAIVVLLTMFTNIFQSAQSNMLRQLVFMLGVLVFLSALLAMLSRLFKILDALRDNSAKLEAVAGALEKISSGLTQINHSTRVSETVKAIAFRDADRQSLREAVFDKLQQQEFDAAQEIIDEIANRSEYSDLAEKLRAQVEQYHTATDQERINQAIAHIEKLLDNCYWAAWDDAVQQQETDRSLEILKELDLYLTPNEGLALQEAARDIFRTKLHNLGVQFSIAVTEKQWTGAFNIGQQIIKDFPNSRMSDEIRGKLNVLEQNVQMQNS